MSVESGESYARGRVASWRPSDPPGEDEIVQNLVRALVRRVFELRQHREGRDPLLDCTELGFRCLLLPLTAGGHDSLSPRENEIARMVALGHTNRAIASLLDISLYTVSTHMRRIFTKLGVGTRAEMIAVLSDNPQLRFMPGVAAGRASAELGAGAR